MCDLLNMHSFIFKCFYQQNLVELKSIGAQWYLFKTDTLRDEQKVCLENLHSKGGQLAVNRQYKYTIEQFLQSNHQIFWGVTHEEKKAFIGTNTGQTIIRAIFGNLRCLIVAITVAKSLVDQYISVYLYFSKDNIRRACWGQVLRYDEYGGWHNRSANTEVFCWRPP